MRRTRPWMFVLPLALCILFVSASAARAAEPIESPAAVVSVEALAVEAPAAVVPAAPSPANSPLWAQITYAVLAAIISAFLLPFLKRKAEVAKAEAARLGAVASAERLGTLGLLEAQLKEFLLERAVITVEKDFPQLAASIIADPGAFKVDAIKERLKTFGLNLKDEAIAYFSAHKGVDLLSQIGDQQLDKFIRWAADRVSPFPGKSTAVALLDKGADMLVAKGAAWLRMKFMAEVEAAGKAEGKASVVPAPGA